jgi:hypothetical protein
VSPVTVYNTVIDSKAVLKPQKGDTRVEIIALDAHKRYSQVCVQNKNGQFLCEKRINHCRGTIKQFLDNWTTADGINY